MADKNKAKRALLVLNTDHFFITHRVHLAEALRNNGYDVHIATPPGKMVDQIKDLGFTYHPLLLGRKSINPFSELYSLFFLIRLYRKIRPTIAHHFTIKPMIYGTIAAKVTKTPGIINAVTGLGYVFVDGGLKTRALRYVIEKAYRIVFSAANIRVIFQNPDDEALFVNAKLVKKSKTKLIKGSGVDVKHYTVRSVNKDTPQVLFAGRMLWDKGVGLFVEAAKELQKDKFNVRFVLVGDVDLGYPSAVSYNQLMDWHKSGIVEWRGRQTDMPSVYAESHILCLPSYYREGVPKVLIEAAACGRPAITTDMPGCREIVRHRQNGLLIPPRDVESLTSALKYLLENPQLCESMGMIGRDMVEQEFSIDKVINKTLQIYDSLSR